MNNLPDGWELTTIGKTFNVTLGQSPPSSTYNNENIGLPFFQGKAEFGEVYPYIKKWCSSPKKIANKDSVLISVRAPVGPTNLAPEKCCIGRGLAAIEPLPDMNSTFILHQLRSMGSRISGMGTGTTFKAITGETLRQIPFLIPPLPEQQRIVAKIEELFTKLDAGVETLKKAKTLLKQYRQSVLKAAVEGRLTEEWRREKGERIEPASVLLERIQAERKQRLGSKYKPPRPVDTSNLPELPDGWVWANIQSIGEVVTGTTPSKSKIEYYGNDYPFYKPTDLNSGYFVNNSTDALSYIGIEKARLLPENTVLVTCIGATIGKTGLIRKEGASNQQINAILTGQCIYSEYLYFTAISPFFQNQIISKASSTTLPILNKSKFEELPIMIPSIEEQVVIVKEIERLFSIIDDSKMILDAELKRSQSLRQSILKRAFEGKLVPQDPADEPASVLLERIKREKNNRK